jgi:hypothetical protein
MKAIVQNRYGSPDVLELREVENQRSGTIRCSSGFAQHRSTPTSGM